MSLQKMLRYAKMLKKLHGAPVWVTICHHVPLGEGPVDVCGDPKKQQLKEWFIQSIYGEMGYLYGYYCLLLSFTQISS